MKLVTYKSASGHARTGALLDNGQTIADLEIGHTSFSGGEMPELASLQSLIEGGEGALELARDVVEFVADRRPGDAVINIEDTELLAPLPRPVQMRDFLCFELHLKQSSRAVAEIQASMTDDPDAFMKHAEESGRLNIPEVWYEQPLYYKCNRLAVIGPEAEVQWPRYSMALDYELEMGAIIGRQGKDIAREDALSYVFGYTIFNDISARDAQGKEMAGMLGPAKGKDFDTSNILGPCIVTADELEDPYNLTMVARVNGEEWSRGNSGTMYHKFEDMIAHVSQSETLYPGEVLGSGTVGNGCGLELKRFLSPGDIVELEIEGIGTLRNRIGEAP